VAKPWWSLRPQRPRASRPVGPWWIRLPEAPVYGVNTGFGTLAEVHVAASDLKALQRNLILSHAAGVGDPLSLEEAQALMVLRANVLAKGCSGVRLETLELVVELLNRDIVPVVPQRGSVGASGPRESVLL